jgi:hypothetical protein
MLETRVVYTGDTVQGIMLTCASTRDYDIAIDVLRECLRQGLEMDSGLLQLLITCHGGAGNYPAC